MSGSRCTHIAAYLVTLPTAATSRQPYNVYMTGARGKRRGYLRALRPFSITWISKKRVNPRISHREEYDLLPARARQYVTFLISNNFHGYLYQRRVLSITWLTHWNFYERQDCAIHELSWNEWLLWKDSMMLIRTLQNDGESFVC